MSTGETDLARLLQALDPVLYPEPYVFETLVTPRADDLISLQPIATFQEEEGLSLIVRQRDAQLAGLWTGPVFRRITLRIHSSLEAVGLTAAISSRLADAGLSANVVAAFHHDHVFVPAERAEEALKVLQELQNSRP